MSTQGNPVPKRARCFSTALGITAVFLAIMAFVLGHASNAMADGCVVEFKPLNQPSSWDTNNAMTIIQTLTATGSPSTDGKEALVIITLPDGFMPPPYITATASMASDTKFHMQFVASPAGPSSALQYQADKQYPPAAGYKNFVLEFGGCLCLGGLDGGDPSTTIVMEMAVLTSTTAGTYQSTVRQGVARSDGSEPIAVTFEETKTLESHPAQPDGGTIDAGPDGGEPTDAGSDGGSDGGGGGGSKGCSCSVVQL